MEQERDVLVRAFVETLNVYLGRTTLTAYFADYRHVVRWCTDGFVRFLKLQRETLIDRMTIWDVKQRAREFVLEEYRGVFDAVQDPFGQQASEGRLPDADASTYMKLRGKVHHVSIHSDAIELGGRYLGRFIVAIAIEGEPPVGTAGHERKIGY